MFSKTHTRARFIAEKFSVPHYFSSFEDFLSSEIDAVYIGSTNAEHYNQVLLAARAGKHILCEKPLAITARQAEEMVNVCRENNVLLAVNYVYRFHPLIQKAKELVSNQTIGKIVTAGANFNINITPGENFRFNKELSGGGAMRDLGTHMIDLFRYVGGELTPIYGILDNVIYKTEVEDYAFALLRFENGGYCHISVSFNSPRASNRIEIIGSKGSIAIDNLVASRYSSAKMTIMLEKERNMAFRKRTNKLSRLLRSVNTSFIRNEEPLVTGYDGFINMSIMEALENNASKK